MKAFKKCPILFLLEIMLVFIFTEMFKNIYPYLFYQLKCFSFTLFDHKKTHRNDEQSHTIPVAI